MNTVFIPGLGFNTMPTCSLSNQFFEEEPTLLSNTLPHSIHELLPHIPQDAHLIGWSFGGLVAIAFCAQFPSHCRAITLLASTPAFLASDDWPGVTREKATSLMQLHATSSNQFDERFLSLVSFPSRNKTMRAQLQKHYQTPTTTLLHSLFQTDLRLAFSTIAIPLKVYLAENDAILPSKQLMPALKTLNPAATITIIKNASHAFFLEEKTHEYCSQSE